MIDLFIPFVLGLVLGIEPQSSEQVTQDTGSAQALAAPARAPEPQIATGKFTTALEVRPILGMTKANWVGVREYEGQDLVYFTHLMSWRCGLWEIRYGINGAPPRTPLAMEPCNDDFAQPNVMVDVETFPPYVAFAMQSVQSITVEIVFDDGMVDAATFDRADIRIP